MISTSWGVLRAVVLRAPSRLQTLTRSPCLRFSSSPSAHHGHHQRNECEIVDGKKIANEIKVKLAKEIKHGVEDLQLRHPSLAILMVGSHYNSEIYIKKKRQLAKKIGVSCEVINFEEQVLEGQLLETIDGLNRNDHVDGIILQLPLPAHLEKNKFLNAICPSKDVDGLGIANQGDVIKNGEKAGFVPCTPGACLSILDHHKVDVAGKRAVVIGRSELVGMPMSVLLLRRNATVTTCHRFTRGLRDIVPEAEVLVVAAGSKYLVKGDWIRKGAIVIDVGLNPETQGQSRVLFGDVEFEEARKKSSLITPVPGGVGPLTVVMLMRNTVLAWKRRMSIIHNHGNNNHNHHNNNKHHNNSKLGYPYH